MLVFAACTQSVCSTAQFIYNPLPVKQGDFKKIKALGYTKCYVFKLSREDKFLYQEAEYGAQGLVAGFYEKGFNDNAAKRAIVVHGADYVNEDWITTQGYIGRSQGCPALPPALSKPLIDDIKDGTCLFIYHPNALYLSKSQLVK